MTPIRIRAGQSIKFDVDIKGEPAPTAKWTFKTQELKTLDNVKVEHIEYNSKLIITEAVRKYTGIYKLTAVNDSGTDEADVEVNVLDKPGKPEGPIEVTDVHKEGCKIKWKPPKVILKGLISS